MVVVHFGHLVTSNWMLCHFVRNIVQLSSFQINAILQRCCRNLLARWVRVEVGGRQLVFIKTAVRSGRCIQWLCTTVRVCRVVSRAHVVGGETNTEQLRALFCWSGKQLACLTQRSSPLCTLPPKNVDCKPCSQCPLDGSVCLVPLASTAGLFSITLAVYENSLFRPF